MTKVQESTSLGLTITFSGLSEYFTLVKAPTKPWCNALLKYACGYFWCWKNGEKIKPKCQWSLLCSYRQVNSDTPQCTFTVHDCSPPNDLVMVPCSVELVPLRTSGTWRQVGSPRSHNATAVQDYLQLKTFVLLGLVKPHSFARRSEFFNRKCSPRTDHLWTFSLFFRHSKGEGGIRGQSACTQSIWQKETGKPNLEISER